MFRPTTPPEEIKLEPMPDGIAKLSTLDYQTETKAFIAKTDDAHLHPFSDTRYWQEQELGPQPTETFQSFKSGDRVLVDGELVVLGLAREVSE